MAQRAGVNYDLPPLRDAAMSGPDAGDIETAEDMSPEDRMAMIRGMVEGLADRLANEGGPPEEWNRLIGSLIVLGDQAQAIAIYNNALEVFGDNPIAIETIRDGARDVGLIP
jgi:cytochrome c-type biogenesis protein CcmH